MQDALQLSIEKKRRIVENRRQLLLNLEQLLRKQNMVRSRPPLRCTRHAELVLTVPLDDDHFIMHRPPEQAAAAAYPEAAHPQAEHAALQTASR